MSKDFQKLTIKDAFMFAAVMSDEEKCQKLLEMALNMKILRVSIVTERALSYHPQYHSVRLDVLAEEYGTRRRFNVEMQVENEENLPHRTRYYHSQMDLDILAAGEDYSELPNTYVIFICDFVPFKDGKRLYRYTFRRRCDEDLRSLEDGSITIILSTKGENEDELPKELVHFLQYVGNPQELSETASKDQYIQSLECSIADIKRSRSWEAKFVLLEEMMNKERRFGRLDRSREAVLELLALYGNIPEDIRLKVNEQKDENILKKWLLAAAKADSFDAFRKQM